MNHTAAIVTGGNRGVGEGICYALASKGYDIFMAHCGEADKAAHVAQQLREKFGVRVVTFDCDQRERTIGETLMTQALLAFPSISLVMCNAGVGLEKYMRLIHPEEIDYVYEVNFRGSLLIANAAAKYMVDRGIRGTILFTSSIRSKTPTPMDAIYGGLKAGLNRAAQSWRVSTGGMGFVFRRSLPDACACIQRAMRIGITQRKSPEFHCGSAVMVLILVSLLRFLRRKRLGLLLVLIYL